MLLRTCVARGALWLDGYDPTWHQRINVSSLENDDRRCVLGQAFGHFYDFIDARYMLPDAPERWWQILLAAPRLALATWFIFSHGFMPVRDPEVVWRRLWEAEVLKRQAGTAAPVEQAFPHGGVIQESWKEESWR